MSRTPAMIWEYHLRYSRHHYRTLQLWFISQFLLRLVQISAGQGSGCSPGFYGSGNGTTEEQLDCVPCTVCGPGQGVVAPCTGSNDTECADCPTGQFSRLTTNGRVCTRCESCTPERTVTSPCTSTQDSICGRCSRGHFLYVTDDGSKCLRCSKCPTNRVTLHWMDCAEAGEPVWNQCAPGIDKHTSIVSSTTVQQPSTASTTVRTTTKTKLPTDHGKFIPMTTYKSQFNDLPLDSQTPMHIAIVSAVFTGATAIACVGSIICLLREKYCKRSTKYWKGTLSHPVQVEDDVMPAHIRNHYNK